MRYRGAALAVLLAAIIVDPAAAAEPGPPAAPPTAPARVVFRRSACVPLATDEAAFVSLLGIELAADGVTEVSCLGALEAASPAPIDPADAVLSLEGACDPGASITVEITAAATVKRVRRVVALGDLPPPARARALALATAELMRTSWAELAQRDALPRSRRARPTARVIHELTIEPPEDTPAAPIPVVNARGVLLGVALEGRFFTGGLGTLGARASASFPVPSTTLLRLRLDGGVAHGTATDPLGKADIWLASGAIGPSLAVGSQSAWLELGPRLELGVGYAKGSSTSSRVAVHQGTSFVSTASLLATGRLHVGQGFWAALDLDLGAVLAGFVATADDRDAAALGGMTGAARLGLARTF